MRSAADIAAEMDVGLQAVFQAGLTLALQVQQDAMDADTPDDRARLALSFHRLSRSVRQTAALRMRLAREAERSGREQASEVVRRRDAQVAARRGELTAAVGRLIWREAEDSEIEGLELDLSDLLDNEAGDAAFTREPVDVQIARLCELMRLTNPTTPTVILRSGATPDPGDPSRVPGPSPQLGSPASPGGRAEDDAGADRRAAPPIPDHPFRSSG